jgi:hypothetical protein
LTEIRYTNKTANTLASTEFKAILALISDAVGIIEKILPSKTLNGTPGG